MMHESGVKNHTYSSGELMRLAHITKKTIRYYDEHNILKPSFVSPTGARFYTDDDLARLQRILLLKYLGFSLEDIREMTINDSDSQFMASSLELQMHLVEDRIEQLQLVAQAIRDTAEAVRAEKQVDWSQMLDLIHDMGMEKSLKNQYRNASNIVSRINLHKLYSQNTQGWFPWIFSRCDLRPQMRILELGCGDGTFWSVNASAIPEDIQIVLSDVSEGMLRDARRALEGQDSRFSFAVCDCQSIPYMEGSFDLVIANHVLFYCGDVEKACSEVNRVLKPGGRFLCSTYGAAHMQEVSSLVSEFDDRIILSAEKLYKRFGRENGADILNRHFSKVSWNSYEDALLVPDSKPLISYILSCHGNQNQYILDRYKDFCTFVRKKTEGGFHITKDAGIFLCEK